MRGLGRKASFLLVLAVIATALTGAAYSLWYEDVAVNAQVSTGNLDVQFSQFFCTENEDIDFVGDPFDDGFVWVGKEVGSFVRTSPPADALTLTITNGYPGYAVDCKVDVQNIGNIPVHIEREYFDFDLDNDGQFDDLHVECVASGFQPDCRNLDPLADPWTSSTNPSPLYVRWVDGLGCQIHAPDRNSGDFFIGIRQPAAENATYRVRMTIQFNQWNESGWTGCYTPNSTPFVPVNPPANP